MLVSCRADVVIGVEPRDAAPVDEPDASAPVEYDAALGIMSGSYSLDHGPMLDVSCTDPDDAYLFEGLTPADVGLAAGDVELQTTGEGLVLTGAAIASAYGKESVTLVLDLLPDQPPDLFFTVELLSREGPENHQTSQVVLGFYETGANENMVAGESGALFADELNSVECGVIFHATLMR